MLSTAEKTRITRKTSIAEDDLDVNGKVERVLNALQGEDELEKSKIAKIFLEKSKRLTLGIKKPTLEKLLLGQNKSNMSFPRAMGFKATQKIFTREDADGAIKDATKDCRGTCWSRQSRCVRRGSAGRKGHRPSSR